jgi:hypothetical protein
MGYTKADCLKQGCSAEIFRSSLLKWLQNFKVISKSVSKSQFQKTIILSKIIIVMD